MSFLFEPESEQSLAPRRWDYQHSDIFNQQESPRNRPTARPRVFHSSLETTEGGLCGTEAPPTPPPRPSRGDPSEMFYQRGHANWKTKRRFPPTEDQTFIFDEARDRQLHENARRETVRRHMRYLECRR
ncbi:MAG: uncharacterized protein KVP18_000608 [Porospora cf. gigantea A]|uniref:uncharacterized protein n=1 Tax=Porospora cf. gigantea A TaxID=2853593 RepID=UPI0035599F21|nr:MAG: hypothetical protein KVP18_000608 [Porospora cf. gigantea A]